MSEREEEGEGHGYCFFHSVPVRFSDVDLGGHAHHSQALVYFEEAREAYWRKVVEGGGEGVGYILAEAQVRYHARILYPQTLEVAVRVSVLGKKHFVMEYEARSPDGEPLASGSTVMVLYDYDAGRTGNVSDEMRRKIQAHEGRSLPRRRGREA